MGAMTTPMKSFKASAVEAQTPDRAKLTPLPFEFETRDGTKHEFLATFPADGDLFVFTAAQGIDSDDAERAGSMLGLIEGMFPTEKYRLLRSLLRSKGGLPPEMSTEVFSSIFEYLMETWNEQAGSAFPTQPPADSATSPRAIGGRSTGRAPGKGSTRQPSRTAAS